MPFSKTQPSRRGVVLAGLSAASALAVGRSPAAKARPAAVPANPGNPSHYTRENISTYLIAL